MYSSRSRSPASFAEGRNYTSYSKGTSYNYSTDFSLSSLGPRNPSIQRVINTDYGLSEYSRSPLTDYSTPVSRLTSLRSLPSSLSGDTSPTFRRRDPSSSRTLNDRSSSVTLRSEDLGYSPKSRNYFDYSSAASSLFTSYVPPIKHIKKPQRTDYTDYLRPVLTARPVLKSGYVPRSRDEREDNSIPLVRERKLIKFREMSNNILSKVRRKISWDLPEEISSPLIDEIKQLNSEGGEMASEQIRSRESSLIRRSSQDILSYTPSTSPMSGSPRPSISRRSSGDQSLDNLSRIRRLSPRNINSAISREPIYHSFDSKSEDMSINQQGKAPIPPPRNKSLGSSQNLKKPRKSSVEMLLSGEKSSNFSKIANEIRRNREAESSNASLKGSLCEKQRSSQEEVPVLPSESTSMMDTKLSSTVSDLIAVKELTDADNDRGRRRRRRTLPEHEVEPSETRNRCRSRFRSQLPSENYDQSTEVSSNQVSEITFPNETPYPACRMHRKSVKYKEVLPPRRRSKCLDTVADSINSTPISLEPTPVPAVESNVQKTMLIEEQNEADFNKFKQEISSNVTAKHKKSTQNKIKHEEAELISDTMQKLKLESSSPLSGKVKTSEKVSNLDKKIVNCDILTVEEASSNDKYSPQAKSKSKFENFTIGNVINENDTKSKTPKIAALDKNAKQETKSIDVKNSFNKANFKIGNGQSEAKPTLMKKIIKNEIKLTEENNSYKIKFKEETKDDKLPIIGSLNKIKESSDKNVNKSKSGFNNSKVLSDTKSKIESKLTIANSAMDNNTITEMKVTDTNSFEKSKVNTELTNIDKVIKHEASKLAIKDANINNFSNAEPKAETDNLNASLHKSSKVEGKATMDINSASGIKANTETTRSDTNTSNLKKDTFLKNEVSQVQIKESDVSRAKSNTKTQNLSNKTFESEAGKVTIANSTFDSNIRTEVKDTHSKVYEKSKLDATTLDEEKCIKHEVSKFATIDINANISSGVNSQIEIDMDSKLLYKNSKIRAKVEDNNSVVNNNIQTAVKVTDTKNVDISKLNEDNSLKNEVSKIKFKKDSDVKNKILVDKILETEITKVANSTIGNTTKTKVNGSDIKIRNKELDLKMPIDKTTTKLPDINQLKNSNIKVDIKNSAVKEPTESLEKSVVNHESKNRIEKSQCQKTTTVPKIQEKVVQRKELEEIVVVCKLPPPKVVCKLPPSEPVTVSPNIPSVVISIKNSVLKTVNDTANSDILKHNSAIIPSKELCSKSKLESCETLKEHGISEESEVKVIHTVVLKPKVQRKSLENKSIPTKKTVRTHEKLKAIPDVIKSTVRIDSKANREVSDIVKSSLNKDNDEVKINKILPNERSDSFHENFENKNTMLNRKITVADKLLDSNRQLVTERSKEEPQVNPSENGKILNTSNEGAVKDLLLDNMPMSKLVIINGSDTKESSKPDLIQMTTATEKICERLNNISKDSIPEKSISDKKIFKIQHDKCLPVKVISESKSEPKQSTIVSDLDEISKVKPVSYEEKFKNAISFCAPKHELKEIMQKSSTGSNKTFKTNNELPVLENKEKVVMKIGSDKNKSDFERHSINSFDKNKITETDLNGLTNDTNKNLISETLMSQATEVGANYKDEKTKNKTIFPQIEEVGKKSGEILKNKTDKCNLILNQTDIKKGKFTTCAYKKSVTSPNIANLLEENDTSKVSEYYLQSTQKIKKTEPASLSTDNVPRTLQEKSFTKIKNKEFENGKSGITLNSVAKLTRGEKTDREKSTDLFKVKKEILTDICHKNSSDNLRDLPSSIVIADKSNESDLSSGKIYVADNSTSSTIKGISKAIPIFDETINSSKENKINSDIKDKEKQVGKQVDINLEVKEPIAGIKVGEKTEPLVDNTNKCTKNDKDISAMKTNFTFDETVTKIPENNSTFDTGQDKQKPSEVSSIPSLQDAKQPINSVQKTDVFIKKDISSMPTGMTLDTNLISRVEGVMKNDITRREEEATNTNNLQQEEPKKVHVNVKKDILKDNISPNFDKNLLRSSEKTSNSEILNSSKDDSAKQKESTPVTQKPDLNEVKLISDSQTLKTNKPKETKPTPVPPPYGRIGLFLKPKEPPQTILESSSSEEESESETSEDESNPVVNKSSTLTNGKSPDRDEKGRSRSETSNASIYSNFSNSTTYTTLSTSSIDDEYKSPIKPKEKLKQLRFRKYEVDDFVFLKLLGKGSFGKVLLAELKESEMYFAIKCLKKDVVLEDDDVESTMIERRVLALGTQHPYMCKLYCTFQTKSYLFFVMEYLNGGDLMFHIQESRPFKEDRAMFYAAEIVSALKFLHKRGIVYRDIKLDNVMLDEQGHVRLVDFGMCQCRIYMEECMPSNFCGTPSYIAPEIVLGQKYNQSVDWWSFGILLYEMLSGRSPFHGTDEDELFWSICNEEPHYPRFLSKEAILILGLLLQKSPSKRLGMPTCPAGDIKDHAFFSIINWDKIEKKQVPPPFKPSVSGPSDTSNFDSSFTMDSATLSPVENEVLESMDQQQFHGFSYTNPHITD